jgi:hypothetical protein
MPAARPHPQGQPAPGIREVRRAFRTNDRGGVGSPDCAAGNSVWRALVRVGKTGGIAVAGVGLLFFCYQPDIWEQFEFIQRFWANNPLFVEPGLEGKAKANYPDATGIDAVIGQAIPDTTGPLISVQGEPPRHWPGRRSASESRAPPRAASHARDQRAQ